MITKKVAILIHNYFEQSEFTEPKRALLDAGAAVDVVSAAGRLLQAMRRADKADTFQADLILDDANFDDYDALVVPGGVMHADRLRMEEAAQQWLRQFLDDGKPVALICHAPWVLVSAGYARGRRLTSYETIQDDVLNAGGEWLNREVVVDRNLITSRKPADLPAFNDALLRTLHDERVAVTV